MNFNIPDKIYKLIIFIGFTLIVYSYLQDNTIQEKYFSLIDKHTELQDSIKLNNFILNKNLEQLKKKSDQLSTKYNIDNPLQESDSLITFTKIHKGSNHEKTVSDSINILWTNYLHKKYLTEIQEYKLSLNTKNLRSEEDFIESIHKNNLTLIILGCFLLIIGFAKWLTEDELSSKQRIPFKHTFCQSCGKRFSSVREYSQYKNGEKNFAYCTSCYVFTRASACFII